MTILDKIIQQKEFEVRELKAIYSVLMDEDATKRPSLYESFRQSETMNVIAEVKRASPSKGVINEEVDPVIQAKTYQEAGAGAISVLTDRLFFQGTMADLSRVAANVPNLPILCKDFIIDEVQIQAAKDHGASVILLIVAALSETRLKELYDFATSLHLDVLVEVHNEEEAESALNIGANIIGVNNRNLKTFEVDLEVTERLASYFQDEDILFISESGIKTKDDVHRVAQVGAKGILVGETLMKAENVAETLSQFRIPLPKGMK